MSIGAAPLETGDAMNVIDTTANGVLTRFISVNDDEHGARIILQKKLKEYTILSHKYINKKIFYQIKNVII